MPQSINQCKFYYLEKYHLQTDETNKFETTTIQFKVGKTEHEILIMSRVLKTYLNYNKEINKNPNQCVAQRDELRGNSSPVPPSQV